MKKPLSRRNFTKVAAASSVYSLLPSNVLGANEKVNIAYIGIGAQGGADAKTIDSNGLTNTVALCDIAMGTKPTASIEKKFPGRAEVSRLPQDVRQDGEGHRLLHGGGSGPCALPDFDVGDVAWKRRLRGEAAGAYFQ